MNWWSKGQVEKWKDEEGFPVSPIINEKLFVAVFDDGSLAPNRLVPISNIFILEAWKRDYNSGEISMLLKPLYLIRVRFH